MSDNRRFYEDASRGARRSAPAALRNREPIAEVLSEWLPPNGIVLEIASGSGEHAIHFAERFPQLDWQPSDIHPDWPITHADALLSINMVHISPWASALGLLDGAHRLLRPGAPLILYGPWLTKSIPTVQSNLDFDQDLQRRDSAWGLRMVEDFAAAAEKRGLELVETRTLPANNMMLLLRRR